MPYPTWIRTLLAVSLALNLGVVAALLLRPAPETVEHFIAGPFTGRIHPRGTHDIRRAKRIEVSHKIKEWLRTQLTVNA